jgi:hypothetical protein
VQCTDVLWIIKSCFLGSIPPEKQETELYSGNFVAVSLPASAATKKCVTINAFCSQNKTFKQKASFVMRSK